MYELPPVTISDTVRDGAGLWLGEVVATTGLIAVIVALARTGRAAVAAVAVASWIGAAYWFTSSTSLANPAVTIAWMFSDTFAGITPASVPAFVQAQIIGAAIGAALAISLHPVARSEVADVVAPREARAAVTPTEEAIP